MAAVVTTPTALRGLLVHDPRFAEADITASQSAGPHPAQPVSTALTVVSSAVLETSGDSDGTTRYLHCTRGGGGTPDSPALWGWSTDGTSATQRGAWSRQILTEVEPVDLTAASYDGVAAIVTRTGRLIIAAYNGTKIVSFFKDQDDTSVTATGLASWGTGADVTASGTSKPRAMYLDPVSSRVYLLVSSTATYGTTTYATLNLYYTDSEAATWTLAATDVGVRIDTASLTVSQIRAVQHNGYVTVIVRATSTACGSWVSYDMGATFVAVEAMAAFSTDGSIDAVGCDDGSVLLVYTESHYLCIARKRSPVEGFAADVALGTAVAGANTASFSGSSTIHLAATLEQDGTISAIGRLNGDRRYLSCRMRQDITASTGIIQQKYGADSTWVEPAYFGSGATGYFLLHAFVSWKDGLYAVTLDNAASAVLQLIKFGGWSSADWGLSPSFGVIEPGTPTYSGWAWCWPLSPTGCGWTATGAGTGTAPATGGWKIVTSANQLYYSRNGSATGTPLLLKARVRHESGGTLTSDDVAIRLIRDTGAGTNRYDVSVRFSGTGIRLYDNTAAGTVGSDASGLTSDDFLDVIVTMVGARVAVYYCTPGSSLWTVGPYGNATAAATAGTNQVRWGNLSIAGTGTSHWAFVLSALDDRIDSAAISEPVTTRPFWGREMSARPLWLQSGISVRARSTPVLVGETWSVGTVYDYGALDPVSRVGPGERWRSTSDASEVTLFWTLDHESAGNSYGWSPSYGICLRRANFRTAYLEAYDGSSWTALVNIDTATGMTALEFVRVGYVLAPSGSPVGGRYAQHEEYAGGYALLVSGTTLPVRLAGNQGGAWRGSGGTAQMILRIDPTTDLTGLHASGTIHIIPPVFVGIAHGAATGYRTFRLRIPAQDTAEGYFTMAPPILGPFVAFGRQYSQGRLVGPILTASTTTLRSGASRSRALVRPRRYVEIAWKDVIVGGGTGGAFGASPEPAVVAAYSSSPVAMARDPAMIEGLLQVARGGQQPVVYLPSVATGAASTQISARELVLPGRIVGEGGARTAVTGRAEYSDEGSTLGTLRIEELPEELV